MSAGIGPPVPDFASLPQGPARPASVTTLAVIGIVLASLGLSCLGTAGLVQVLRPAVVFPTRGMGPVRVAKGPATRAVEAVGLVAGLAFSGILLAGGIGSLNLRRGARVLMLRWATFYIVWVCVRTLLVFLTMPEAVEAMRQAREQGAILPPWGMRFLTVASALFLLPLYLTFPILVLIFYRRPNVVSAFENQK